MIIKDYKCKCGHNDFFFADKGNQKGIYCAYCGKWLKWADKDEQNVAISQYYRMEVEKLPPVTTEPKVGHWILNGGYWRCSECKEKALLKLDKAKGNCKEYMPIRSDYCPNCGAKMIEPQERK